MRGLIFAFVLAMLPLLGISQTSTTSDGNWSTGGNWSSGVPGDSDDATINHDMTMDTDIQIKRDWVVNDGGSIIDEPGGSEYKITIENGGTLDISGTVRTENEMFLKNNDSEITIRGCDTLEVGNLNLENSSFLTIESCGVLIINGDLNIKNSHIGSVNGSIKVNGDVTAENSATLTGTGNLSATGSVDIKNSATLFGSSSDCGSSCFYGTGFALPVELVRFEATYNKSLAVVELTWETATEINNDYFEIQRSADAETWSTIAYVNGQGTISRTTEYTFTDESAPGGVCYYRLLQVDFDGRSELFDLVSVSTPTSSDWKVGPNPFSDQVNIQPPEAGAFTTSIFSTTGQLLSNHQIQQGQSSVATDRLPAGTYLLVIQDQYGQRVHSQQLIKF